MCLFYREKLDSEWFPWPHRHNSSVANVVWFFMQFQLCLLHHLWSYRVHTHVWLINKESRWRHEYRQTDPELAIAVRLAIHVWNTSKSHTYIPLPAKTTFLIQPPFFLQVETRQVLKVNNQVETASIGLAACIGLKANTITSSFE